MVRGRMVVLVLGIAVTLLWGGYTLDYSLSQFSFHKENGFDRISANGFVCVDEPGIPELPSIYLHYIIPPNANAESLIELQHSMMQIPGQFLIHPTQPPVVPGETVPWVPPDTLIYNADEIYPRKFIEIVNEGVMDGARIVTITVHPLRYRPQSRRLYLVTHAGFDFELGQGVLPEVRPLVRGENEQVVYDAALNALVENDHEIPVYYQRPVMMSYSQLGTLLQVPAGPAMIITDPAFAPAFQPYADWLTDQGIRAQLISPQLIYSYFSGVDEAARIRNYIKYCYQNAGGTWFILGGDGGSPPKLPYRKCHCYVHFGDWQDTIPCDHYFCTLDGDWNGNGNNVWGEMDDDVDQLPEVHVGRIPCGTISEAVNWVEKALNYEKMPANSASMNKVVWIHQNGTWPNQWKMADTTRFPEHYEHIVSENGTAYATFELLNYGYAFTNEQTHGHIDYFPTGYPGGTLSYDSIQAFHATPPMPSSQAVGLNWLSNDARYCINYCVGCKTGAYDIVDLCMADAFVDAYRNTMTNNAVGACASIEHTRASWESWPMSSAGAYSVKLQNEYYDLLLTQEYPGASYSMIGFTSAQAKTRMAWGVPIARWVCYATNLFGSPTTRAWTNVPRNFIVSHPRRIPVGEPTQFVVQVEDGEGSNQPVAYAKVCLNKPGDIYEIKKTTENGQATFPITPRSAGTLKVTITRYHNDGSSYTQYLPSQTTCQVLHYPTGGGPQASKEGAIAPDHLCITQMPTLMKDVALVRYGIPEENEVSFVMYDITGSRVKTIKRGLVHPGYYEEKIDTRDIANGVYFIILNQRNDKVVRKCLVFK